MNKLARQLLEGDIPDFGDDWMPDPPDPCWRPPCEPGIDIWPECDDHLDLPPQKRLDILREASVKNTESGEVETFRTQTSVPVEWSLKRIWGWVAYGSDDDNYAWGTDAMGNLVDQWMTTIREGCIGDVWEPTGNSEEQRVTIFWRPRF